MQDTSTPTSSGVMLRLKEATSELHTKAERSEFQQRLVRGAIPREQYASWLAQLYLVHAELEARVRELVATRPEFAGFVREELFQTPRLRGGPRVLRDPESGIKWTPTATRVVSQIREAAAAAPVGLLGFYYVLEGSKNGSRYIAKALRRAMGITPGAGDRYLDPHGEEQPRLWGAFKQGMDAIPFDEAEVATMIDAARRMFEAAEGIGHDLLAREA